MSEQRYRQKNTVKFPSYDKARAEFDAWRHVDRKRIKLRPDGSFDLIEYAPVPEGPEGGR